MTADRHERQLIGEQIALLHRQAPSSFLGSGLSAAILVWLLWDEPLERQHLLAWLACVYLTLIGRWIEVRRYRADPARMSRGAYWGWAFTAGVATSGVVWGYLGWAFFQPTLLFLFPITLVLAGQTALSVPTVGIFFPAHLTFNLLGMTPFMARNAIEEGRLFHIQSFAIFVFMAACLIFAWRQQSTIRNAIRLQLANLDLLARLTRENERAERARQEAEAANAAKSRFLAAASHDLRQPLQAMTLFTDVIVEDVAAGRRPALAVAQNLRASCEGLETLLDSLLDLSRAEAGALRPEPRDTPLQPLFDRLRREFADQAAAKGLPLRVVATRRVVHSDPALLERMLRNLVANAVRYTETGGILVACRRRGNRLRIEVRDSGIGIPDDVRGEIFREFYQLGNPERDRRKGLGLGLAIVDALARQLGHRIDVRSRPYRGSVFAIELDEGHDSDAVADPVTTLPDHLRGRLIAVIEDEAMIRDALTRLLGGWGCEVVAGENADDILAGLAGRVPAAILADWRLREERLGTDEIARLRRQLGSAIPAVLITGDTAPDMERATGLPVIPKPVQGFRLRARLDALLRKT